MDLTSCKRMTDHLLGEWGTAVVVKRVSLNYSTTPPTETWSQSSTPSIDIQQRGASFRRKDPGIVAETTHVGFCKVTEDLVAGDRIHVGGSSDFYRVLGVDDMVDHLEVLLKFVKGAV